MEILCLFMEFHIKRIGLTLQGVYAILKSELVEPSLVATCEGFLTNLDNV